MRGEYLFFILLMALITAFTRFFPVIVFSKLGIPSWFVRWLKHIPIAVFSALIAPSLFLQNGSLYLSLSNHYLLAGLVTAILAWRYNNFMAATAIGTTVMLCLRVFTI